MVERKGETDQSVKLSLVKGPLSLQEIEAISELYGKYDPKYLNVDFCQHKFNSNLFGYSLHAVAHVGDQLVGHYAIVPIPMVREGRSILGGKGEAFVVKEGFRRNAISVNGRSGLLGIALPTELYRFGTRLGFEVMVMISPTDVGVLHERAGAKCMHLSSMNWEFYIKNPRRWRVRSPRALASAMVWQMFIYAQVICLHVRSSLLRAARFTPSIWFVNESTAEKGWTIVKSPDVMAWYSTMGLQVFESSTESCRSLVAFYEPPLGDDFLEVVDWWQSSPAKCHFLAIVAQAVRTAQKSGKQRVLLTVWNPIARVEASSCQLMGFISRPRQLCLYVYSDDLYYHTQTNLNFHPLFYTTF